jgi:hypothetical protein
LEIDCLTPPVTTVSSRNIFNIWLLRSLFNIYLEDDEFWKVDACLPSGWNIRS